MKGITDFDFGVNEEPEEVKEEVIRHEFLSNLLSARNLAIFNPCDLHGSLKIIAFSVIADKDYKAGSTFSLCRLPQSQIRILGAISQIRFKLSCDSVTLGWPKFKKRNQQFVEADYAGFGKVEEMNSCVTFLEHLPAQTIVIDSLEGAFVVVTAETDGCKDDSIDGYFIYIKQ
jgi:hypothetical protein